MATMSAPRRFTRWTIASTKPRLIVGPTWMSLICAMVKPSSSGGSPASGTSTSTTGAVRRAMTNPINVIRGVSNITPTAERRVHVSCAAGDSASAVAARLTSRATVSTSSHDRKPIATQGTRTDHGPRSRARNPLGSSHRHAASTAAPASCTASPKGVRRRTPI